MKIVEGKEAEYAAFKELNSTDSYSSGVVRYVERWAGFMEKLIERYPGTKIADIAEETSRSSDTEGITGFMYSCAVGALSTFWVHGEELRRWHNKDWLGEEEGEKANAKPGAVVNTAILTVSVPEEK